MDWFKSKLKCKKQTDSSQALVETRSPQENRPNIMKRIFPSSRSTSSAIFPSTFDPSDKGASSSSAPEPSTVGVNKHDAKYALPPFEPFTLSVDTLRGLHKWNERNQNSRLAAVLEQVTGAIESKGVQLALEMIPNDPFPVGTLVKGLVAIAVYEMQILSRKQQAHDFAMDRVKDLEAIVDAFGIAPPDSEDPLTLQCWADLTPFCTITNDICKWAHNQITSNQASDEEQQTEFKDQLADANMLFLKLATIRAMRAISGIGQDVVKLLRYNDRIAQLKLIKATLLSHIATDYQYDVQDKQKCHEETREGVLKELDAWIRDDNAPERCWWLTGAAGVGKTAIAMSAVQRFMGNRPLSKYSPKYHDDSTEDAPVLYAQYFCNHKIKSTSTVNNIFPTLTMQLAESSPAAAHIIYGILQKDKTLAHELSQEQAEYLFFAPLCKVADSAPATKFVVVIDGVDEFAEAVHGKITSVLKQVTMSLPINVRLLILSRPETAIMKHIPSDHIRHRDLPTEESSADVRKYLNTIVWDEESTEFPTTTQLELLCISASGHLGWANQAVAWLQGQLKYRDSNSSEFKDDFKMITQIAGGNLDTLYSLILERYLSATDERTRPSVLIGLRNLLGCVLFLHEPQSIGVIRALVPSNSGFDVLKSLKRLGSLYDIGTEPTLTTIPRPPHKSFFDYLTSSRAPDEFRISKAAAHRELASACFRIMKENLHFNMGGFDSPRLANGEASLKVSSPTLYACSSFTHHVEQSGESFVEETSHWMNVLFLFWLEVIILSGKHCEWVIYILGIFSVRGDSELLAAKSSAGLSTSIFYSMLKESVATIYTTILLFVHDSSLITNYRQSSPHIRSLHNTQGASECYAQRPGAFSSDGNFIAIATEDTLSVLSSLGTVLWTKPAKSRPNWLSLSPTGHVLACAYGQTVQCFRIASGEAPMKEVNITDGILWDLKISPDGEYIAGISRKPGTGRASVYIIWIEDGTVIWQREFDTPRSPSIDSVQFLPDNTLANGYGDGRLVDARRRKFLDGFMFDREKIGHMGIRHITASLDGSLLAVVSHGHAAVISIWTTQPERFVTTLAVDSESVSFVQVQCTAFSSDGTLLISGSSKGAVRVWQCATETKTWSCITSLYGHWDRVEFVAFLPGHGNKRVVSRSADATFRIWDISAAVEGREFEIEVDEGTPAEFGAWFRHAIPLGGWLGMMPFVCKFPFKLPAGVEPLDWDLGGSEGWKSGWTLEEIKDTAYSVWRC